MLLTDMRHALDLPKRNAQRNLHTVRAAGGRVETAEHEWGTDVTPLVSSLGAAGGGGVDFVIACEVVYQPESYPFLVKSITDLSGPKTRVLLAVRRRHGTEVDAFLDLMRAGGFVLDRQEGWVGGLGAASLVGVSVTRVKEEPDFFICKMGKGTGKR